MPSPHIFQRHCHTELPVAVAGEGAYLIDADGKRYLDACGGAAVSCLGHSPHAVIEAAKAQLDSLAYAHTSFFTSQAAEELAEALTSRAPDGIERVYFVSGGSEAMESAIKLARQFHIESGESSRTNIIARRQSYHGNTLGALATGGNEWRRAPFSPLLADSMHHIDPAHFWRWGKENETAEEYGLRAANLLEAKLLELGPNTVAAFVAEPVVGATMGAVAAPPGYFKRIREICNQYGVLLILDEVMCGMGRTGSLFASEQEGITPDIVCIAKGLGAGIQPIGAMMCSARIHGAIASGTGFFQHGHTYLGHPVACAASLAVLKEIESRQLLGAVRARGEALQNRLKSKLSGHKNVGDIRGRGLFIGIELVANRHTKAPLDPSMKTAQRIKAAAMQAGLMCYPMQGTIDGQHGDHILLAPPFIIEEPEIEEISSVLQRVVEQVL